MSRVFGAIPRDSLVHPQWGVERIGFQPYPFPSATRFIVDQMKQTLVEGSTAFLGSLDSGAAARELVDDTFVARALDAVGGIGQFCNCDIEKPFTREEIVEIN